MVRRPSRRIHRYPKVPMDDVPLADLADLAGHDPTLADWCDPALQRQRYQSIAERERAGTWRRATVCAQFRADSGWESFLVA